MRKFQDIACCFALIFVYVIAYAGVGVHHCHSDHTSFIRFLAGDISCESIHSHDGNHKDHHHHEIPCGGHCEGTHFHSSSCCDTSIYVITSSQDTEDGDSTSTPERHYISQVIASDDALTHSISLSRYRHRPYHFLDRPLREHFSVWRL